MYCCVNLTHDLAFELVDPFAFVHSQAPINRASVYHRRFSQHDNLNMAAVNWRTINVDALDPESSQNFDLSTLLPAGITPISTADVQALDAKIRQQSRGGDQQGALLAALQQVPYGADAQGKVRFV